MRPALSTETAARYAPPRSWAITKRWWIVAVLAGATALAATPAALADNGTFATSDPLLNRIWSASVKTATDMVAAGPLVVDALGRPCAIGLDTVLLDGYVRDRCPYVGDQAVTGMTLLVSTPSAAPVLRDMLLWYAGAQHDDGSIPASPYLDGSLTFFDYNLFWVEDVYDYVLYTGDRELAREVWPNLVRLLDGWFPAQAGPGGLLVDSAGLRDYAYVPRAGTTVAYYNAGYVRALELGASIAGWAGQPGAAAGWLARIAPIAAAFTNAFWDRAAGSFRDTTTGPVVHPEDGNAFAILAGLATPAQGRSALDYLTYHDSQPYGSTIADTDIWDGQPWGDQASQRAYPFISYFEVLARYAVGFDASALELIRREWGHMVDHEPGTTMWETIGAGGAGPTPEDGGVSWDHGWSSGAAPALTNYTLGVTPGGPGFSSFTAAPRPSDLTWARGAMPTPHGLLSFAWTHVGRTFKARVVTPVPGTITLPLAGAATLDGKTVQAQLGSTTVGVTPGTHTLVVTRPVRIASRR